MKISVIICSVGILFSSVSMSLSSEQICYETADNAMIVNPGKCPGITKVWGKLSVFGKFKRACKLPRRTKVSQLKVTMKVLSFEKVVIKGKSRGCVAKWRVCSRCKLK